MKPKCFTSEEFWPVVYILNVVCNGIYVTNFNDKIGASEDCASNLLKHYSDQYKKNAFIKVSSDLESY